MHLPTQPKSVLGVTVNASKKSLQNEAANGLARYLRNADLPGYLHVIPFPHKGSLYSATILLFLQLEVGHPGIAWLCHLQDTLLF